MIKVLALGRGDSLSCSFGDKHNALIEKMQLCFQTVP